MTLRFKGGNKYRSFNIAHIMDHSNFSTSNMIKDSTRQEKVKRKTQTSKDQKTSL